MEVEKYLIRKYYGAVLSEIIPCLAKIIGKGSLGTDIARVIAEYLFCGAIAKHQKVSGN